ncbi:hypothetical protein M2164_002293 [Streptomyces sp. SAI-208]|nr:MULTISPECIES: hypothetical protein [unclassified Streptomyces]MDH6515828.1 hypothetical protein [Streptomyces sp. SAI-090]MDH6548040.1 hypothetical protein [Streptomyces sp. SAI-041]MDH6567130.1 hypothetical protein [Streptomyces sp. SAI-117]MDH6587935.1 hypothetical protein [Streptomyces sp. SAI-133]MDH6606658.1 hypothetical protein [Streptomyces sp. SAI-208]
MFRGATARTVVAVVAAVLLALPFFALSGGFATAHTGRQVEAKAPSETKLSGKASRAEASGKRHCNHTGDPTGPLRTRDRHRAVDFAPQGPERPLSAEEPAAAPERVAAGEFPLSRPSTAHAPAALQVFRC